jgi:hypothetical protein
VSSYKHVIHGPVFLKYNADALADVATQTHLSEQLASSPEPTLKRATAGHWASVSGELLTFDGPETRLPAIDRLEGFHPGGPSLYRRILAPVRADGAVCPVWLYMGTESTVSRSTLAGRSSW